eukprot:8987612-Pyramimonas_sp.AAC.1
MAWSEVASDKNSESSISRESSITASVGRFSRKQRKSNETSFSRLSSSSKQPSKQQESRLWLNMKDYWEALAPVQIDELQVSNCSSGNVVRELKVRRCQSRMHGPVLERP